MPTAIKPPTSTLKAQVSSGLFWSAGARIVQQFIQFGFSIVLARLLSPGDYGLMAMVLVFTGFAAMLADGGFSSALVQKTDLGETHVHTVFWLTVFSGVTLTTITYLIAPWLASFYDAPALKPIFRVVALNFTIASFGNVPFALLQKRMQFKAIAHVGTWSMLASGIIGMILALLGASVWCLVAQTLSASLLTALFRWIASKWLPRLVFSMAALKDLWHYASHLYGFNLINYWARNADNFVVGKYFGAPALGVYSRAYMLMLLPITQVNSVISQVVFPAFASIQNDKPRVKSIYLRAMGIVALITFPIMFGLVVTAQPFIDTVYGPKWRAVAPILQILALVGAMQALINSTGWLFLSQGRTNVMFFWGAIFAVLAVASFAVGAMIGSVRAIAECYAVVNGLYFYPALIIGCRVINTKATEVLAAVSGPFLGSLVMAISVAAVHLMVPATWPAWQLLLVLISVGATVYGGFVHLCGVAPWKELLKFVQQSHKNSKTLI
jgi:PST family polysaccharide transporter